MYNACLSRVPSGRVYRPSSIVAVMCFLAPTEVSGEYSTAARILTDTPHGWSVAHGCSAGRVALSCRAGQEEVDYVLTVNRSRTNWRVVHVERCDFPRCRFFHARSTAMDC